MKNEEKKKETNERKPERGKVVPRALIKKKNKKMITMMVMKQCKY